MRFLVDENIPRLTIVVDICSLRRAHAREAVRVWQTGPGAREWVPAVQREDGFPKSLRTKSSMPTPEASSGQAPRHGYNQAFSYGMYPSTGSLRRAQCIAGARARTRPFPENPTTL
jgi:hypothetical protein